MKRSNFQIKVNSDENHPNEGIYLNESMQYIFGKLPKLTVYFCIMHKFFMSSDNSFAQNLSSNVFNNEHHIKETFM